MTVLIPNHQGMDFIPDHMMGPILDNTMDPTPDHMIGPILENTMGPIPDHIIGPILDRHMTDLILDNMMTPDHMMGPIPDNMPNHTRVLIPDQNTEVVILGEITETANSLLGGDKQVALISQLAVVVIIGEETEGDITMCKMKIISLSTAINQQMITTLTGIGTQDQSRRCL